MPIQEIQLPPEKKLREQSDGTFKEETVTPYEIHATGKDVQALRGVLKEQAQVQAHEQWKEWQKYGTLKVSLPDGRTDVVRGDKEKLYRDSGSCQLATRVGEVMPGFGRMKREGIIRSKTVWNHKGEREETRWYKDGRVEVIQGG